MNDVFQEVEQSLREETLAKVWKRWAPFVYAAVAIAIIGVAAYEFMRWQRSEAISAAAKKFESGFIALEANDLPAARARFAELSTNDTGFAGLANHMLAGVERDLTNDAAAVEAHLKAAAKDTGVMGDLAILKLGYIMADTATRAELEAALKPLLDKDTQATDLARELIAAKALAEGDVDFARDTFEALSIDVTAPRVMQERVKRALDTMPARTVNLDAPATAPAAPAPAPAAPAEAAPVTTPAPAPATQPGQQQ